MSITRRQFVRSSSTAAAAMSFSLPMVAASSVLGANDRIRVGVVGLGGRGAQSHVTGMHNQDGVQVVAVCDPDRQRLDRCAANIKRWYNFDVDKYADMRDIMKRKDVDVISIANQVYWHGLSTIWACQAGKHVYVEKPLSRYIWEGRQMVNAARKHGRIVQVGTQHRSMTSIREAITWTRAGHLGKIRHITCFACKPRTPIGKRDKPLAIPDYVDYDLWCGPAKKLPIHRNRLQYDCRYVWNTGSGETVDQGIHELDVARLWLGETMMPRRVMSIGGRFMFNDAGQAANAHMIYYDFPTAPILHEVYNITAPRLCDELKIFKSKGTREERMVRRLPVGFVVRCEGGDILVQAYQSHRTCVAYDGKGKEVKAFSGTSEHFVNFIKAVRSGKREDLNAEIEQGHVSTATCHTANVSYRVGETAPLKRQREQVGDIPALREMHDRFLVHLKHHRIDPNAATLGPWLEIDRKSERFKDHDRANELVRGYYRKPFVVPDLSA